MYYNMDLPTHLKAKIIFNSFAQHLFIPFRFVFYFDENENYLHSKFKTWR